MSKVWVYHETKEPIIVEAKEAQSYYDDGWKDSPRYFVKTTDFDVDPDDVAAVQALGESIEGVKDALNGALNLDEMTKADLIDYADTHFGFTLGEKMKKADMLVKIEALLNGNRTTISH